jgi:hypothetical protein
MRPFDDLDSNGLGSRVASPILKFYEA